MSNSFLQSKDWEEFQKSVGNKIWRLDDILIIKKSLPLGKSYFYIPRADIDINKVVELAKKEKAVFLKIDSLHELKIKNWKLKITRSVDVQPSQTVILDLSKSEEQLLKDMHQKTRYNIRLAEKKCVKFVSGTSKDVEKFLELMRTTTERDGFRAHDDDYYRKMLEVNMFKLYFVEYEGNVVAGGIFSFYKDTVTYLHGASSHEYKSVMAPYVLQWEMIKLAKKQGYKYYDFYGISEQKWPGVTRFKKGFNGQEVNYPGTFDVVLDTKWYLVYKLIRAIKKVF